MTAVVDATRVQPAVIGPSRVRRPDGIEVVAVSAALIALATSRSTDLAGIGDMGLALSLPIGYWLGLLALNLAFAVAITNPVPRPRTMIVLLGCLTTVLFGVASAISPYPRAEPTWRHLGIIEHLAEGGALDGNLDAYFNWPGFFVVGATVSRIAGADTFDAIARWAPVWINGLWLLAMSAPLRLLGADPTRRWIALWVFCLANWIDQDYFSPQAFGFFLYLVVIGVVLWGLGASRRAPVSTATPEVLRLAPWRRRILRPASAAGPRQRAAALTAVLGLGAAITVSHQLTPLMMVAALAILTVFGRMWARRLPLLLAVGVLAWLLTGAASYLNGHPVLSLGVLDESAGANVASRVAGSEGRLVVVYLRMALFGFLLVVAALGWWRRRTIDRGARGAHPALLLVLTPFLLVPLNSYGGEMLLRATLFALPFLALAVAFLFPRQPSHRARTRVAVIAVVTVLGTAWATGSVVARYGNARFDMFTPAEVAAVDELYARAPSGAMLISAAHPTPWRDRHYAEFRYGTIQDLCRTTSSVTECADVVSDRIALHGDGGMLLVLRSSVESLRMQGLLATADLARVEAAILADTGASLVFQNDDARLYAVGGPP